MTSKSVFGWGEYGAILERYAQLVEEYYIANPDVLFIAIGRGGYIPAVVVSHKIDRRFLTLDVKSYEGQKQYAVQISGTTIDFLYKEKVPHVVLIDDIYDTGQTFTAVSSFLKQVHRVKDITIAPVLFKADNVRLPFEQVLTQYKAVVYGHMLPKSAWIVLPYEK